MEGEKASHAACLHASSDAGILSQQAKNFAGERGAAAKIGTLRPELSVGCLKLLEECQGCSAADGECEKASLAVCLHASSDAGVLTCQELRGRAGRSG